MSESIARNPVPNPKVALRKTLSGARRDAASQPAANAALDARLRTLLERLAPRTVGFYWPLPGATRAMRLVRGRCRPARRAARDRRAAHAARVPCMGHAYADARRPSPDSGTGVGNRRRARPVADSCVGFDPQRYRLGYGGGYYDRTLAAWPGSQPPVTVGIAYEACRVDALPAEAHDLALRWIVTDGALYPAAG
ncbi:5-formyltetrahydrofolate cyclo-ligase [Burkholderia cepacia]|nr:5-formyltetrahydrofolate cyclo-ligase [Burkholderia cepacia]